MFSHMIFALYKLCHIVRCLTNCQIFLVDIFFFAHNFLIKKGYDMKSFLIKTNSQFEMINITTQIQNIVYDSGIVDGVVYIFIPHTTASVTINEGADPSVMKDIIKELNKIVPLRDSYLHLEGNSAAHIKSTLVGASEMVMIENGSLVLGTWQAIFFCEFDGQRQRKVFVKVLEG